MSAPKATCPGCRELKSECACIDERPPFAVVEIAWDEDGETRTAKFGPWQTTEDDSYARVIASFAGGWCAGKGIEGATVTLFIGDESIAEGATSPYRA